MKKSFFLFTFVLLFLTSSFGVHAQANAWVLEKATLGGTPISVGSHLLFLDDNGDKGYIIPDEKEIYIDGHWTEQNGLIQIIGNGGVATKFTIIEKTKTLLIIERKNEDKIERLFFKWQP